MTKLDIHERIRCDRMSYRIFFLASVVLVVVGEVGLGLVLLAVNWWGWRATWEDRI